MASWIVFAVAFGAYAWTASAAVGWLDSPEFVAAATSLGIPHPPGHPLPTLLGRAAAFVPLGDLPFRVSLASAAAMALACALLYRIVAHTLARATPRLLRAARETTAAGASLIFGLSAAAWSQAVRAEVYALEAALLMGALAALFRFEERGATSALAAAGLATGLALANHHLVTILFFVPAAAVTLARRPTARAQAVTATLGILGLAAFLYLPVRAAADAWPSYGVPDDAARFAWTVSARAFQKSFVAREGSPGADALQVLGVLFEQATPALGLLSLVGAWRLLSRRPTRRVGALFAGVLVAVAIGPALVGFDPENPDALGYLLPALAALVALAAVGAAALADAIGAAAPRLGPAIGGALAIAATAVAALQAGRFATGVTRRGGDASDTRAEAMLATLPPRAVLVTSYFETLFQTWAARAVFDARPDVIHIDASQLTYPGVPERTRRRHPELAALVDGPLRTGRPAPVEALAALATRRPVAVEPWLPIDAALAARLRLRGPIAEFEVMTPGHGAGGAESREGSGSDDGPGDGDGDRDEALFAMMTDRLLSSPSAADRAGARRVLLWEEYVRAELHCATGRRGAAARALARAVRLAHKDPELTALSRRCGIGPP